jgi:hypothetical protein
MANEIGPIYYTTGATLRAMVFNAAGQVRDVVANAFDAWADADIDDYDILLTEQGTSGNYYANAPTGTTPSTVLYMVKVYEGAVTIANVRAVTHVGSMGADKTGFALSSDGLDSVSMTAPTGLASNYREAMVQLWRRFFKRTTKTATTITTFADNGSTVITTQTISDSAGTQVQGPAS